jgi:hypothetical protein
LGGAAICRESEAKRNRNEPKQTWILDASSIGNKGEMVGMLMENIT